MWRGDPDYGVGDGSSGGIIVLVLLFVAAGGWGIVKNIQDGNHADAVWWAIGWLFIAGLYLAIYLWG